ncbi:MAG TPA: glycosyl hydrolase family 18 protein, partial [bacterium]|nr:glycosyl hydrolase family 18 protein [bacterium]
MTAMFLLKSFLKSASKLPIVFVLLFLSPVLLWAKPSYWVYSYIDANTDVNGQSITFVNDIPWNDITHLIDTFATPETGGALDSTSSCFGSVLVNGAHSHSTRANLSIGGAGNGTNFSSDVGTYQSTFISNITKAVTQVGYDGIDIDWEFPASGDRANLQSFMTNLYNAIKALPASSVDGQARTLTIYIGCGDEMCVSSWGNLATACDAIILSGYDFGYDVYNGPIVDTSQTMSNSCDGLSSGYADVTTLFNLLTSNGVPASKCVLGSPLYGNYPAGGYNEVPIITLLTSGVAGSYNSAAMEQLYTYNGNATTANTQQSFCDKINWALSNGMKGIGLWDTAQACPITNSYAAPIWNTIGGNNACVTVGASSPTATFTKTVTKTFTATATMTATNTFTNTVAHTSTPTFTNTASNTPTRTFTLTATSTTADTLTPTFTYTATNTYTRTFTPTNTNTFTSTITLTPSNTAAATASNTGTIPPTHSPTVTNTASNTFTLTDTATVLNTPTATFTLTVSNTATASYTGTAPPTHSPTVASTFTNTSTPTNSSTFTNTPVNSSTSTFTPTATQVFTHTAV